LVCPFYDHCGVCGGDGQSCCNCPSHGPCFSSRCDISSGACLYTFAPSTCPYGSCNSPTPFFGTGSSLFNAFTFGDFTCYSSDVQGRLAVGGNADIRQYSVACQVSGTTCINYGSVTCGDIAQSGGYAESLVVGGNLFALNAQVVQGNADYGGTFNADPSFQVGAGCSANQASPIDFGASQQYLQTLSEIISNLATTGNVTSQYGSLTLTGTNSATMEVFDVEASVLCTSYGFTIDDVQSTASIFINVVGTSASCGSFGMEGYSPNQVVFNFYQATSLTISYVQWQGSILAPYAAVSAFGGVIDGQVYANSLSGGNNCIQINSNPFTGCIHD